MGLFIVLIIAFGAILAQDSWSGKEYQEHNNQSIKYSKVDVPKPLPQSYQYKDVQNKIQGVKGVTFDASGQSTVGEWPLEQVTVTPPNPRDELVRLSKQKFNWYHDVLSFLTGSAPSIFHGTRIFAELLVAVAADEVNGKFDDFASWDENQLKHWLVSRSAMKPNSPKSRDEMLRLVRDYTIWAVNNTWSDFHVHEWLVSHGIVKKDSQRKLDHHVVEMKEQYHGYFNKLWTTWSDSTLNHWLVEHNIIKSQSQIKRENMSELVSNFYFDTFDAIWCAWHDSETRSQLIEHGYMKSDAHARRDELLKIVSENSAQDVFNKVRDVVYANGEIAYETLFAL